LTGVDDLRPHTLAWMPWFLDVGLAEPLRIDAYLCREARFRSLAVITAGVYGDEHEGPAAITALARILGSHTPAGSVSAVPVVNPMALAAAQRSPDGGNLARMFPGVAGGTPTDRLAAPQLESCSGSTSKRGSGRTTACAHRHSGLEGVIC
jgi:hypothetical protein